MSIAFDSILFATFSFDIIYLDLCLGLVGDVFITNPVLWVIYSIFSIIIKVSIIKSASKYDRYQNEELIGSFAALNNVNQQL